MKKAAIIGGGPAGLMAAEVLANAGHAVTVFDHKPSPGRKFLMAGRGGLNLTHSEPLEDFLSRYGNARDWLEPAIRAFTPADLRAWCEGLGQETFVGSSGRVFPRAMKASPLLRAWMARLESIDVRFRYSTRWTGWDAAGKLTFESADAATADAGAVTADAVLLALGGASWPKLGSDGSWAETLAQHNITLSPLRPSNGGFVVNWSDIFRNKFAGQPLKPITLTFKDRSLQGEAMITERGIEGGGIYALSGILREEITANGSATLMLDLRPGIPEDDLIDRLSAPMRGKSFAEFMRKEAGLSPVATSLLREAHKNPGQLLPEALAPLIKHFPLKLQAPFPIDRAISSAGGIVRAEVDDRFMLNRKPGVFAAGEMLDWEAPTGGYLLQATFATAVAAAKGMVDYLAKQPA
ncbi:MAG: TIGR03862 family flavoprotein [Micavibrio sp.]|nr:TIGR03862 family flavoprotein [Micavibrio sp.]